MKKLLTAVTVLAVAAAPAWAGQSLPLTTTPEPESLALVAAGLAIVGVVAWRRKKRG